MSGVLRHHLGAPLALMIVASGALWAPAGMAHTGSPFAAFFGSWRGSGHVVSSDRHSKRINCRATYSESNGGETLSQSLVCASDSYRFDVRSYVVADGRDVQGRWEETTRNVTGQLSGQVQNGRFDGSIAGPAFAAQMSLRTTERRQTVSITPQGGISPRWISCCRASAELGRLRWAAPL
jgi:hypothetical protein